jgi:hypothetical protein
MVAISCLNQITHFSDGGCLHLWRYPSEFWDRGDKVQLPERHVSDHKIECAVGII